MQWNFSGVALLDISNLFSNKIATTNYNERIYSWFKTQKWNPFLFRIDLFYTGIFISDPYLINNHPNRRC